MLRFLNNIIYDVYSRTVTCQVTPTNSIQRSPLLPSNMTKQATKQSIPLQPLLTDTLLKVRLNISLCQCPSHPSYTITILFK